MGEGEEKKTMRPRGERVGRVKAGKPTPAQPVGGNRWARVNADCWSQVLSWLETADQVHQGATSRLLRAAACQTIVGPATLRRRGVASFVRFCTSNRCPQLEGVVVDRDVDDAGLEAVREVHLVCRQLVKVKICLGPECGVLLAQNKGDLARAGERETSPSSSGPFGAASSSSSPVDEEESEDVEAAAERAPGTSGTTVVATPPPRRSARLGKSEALRRSQGDRRRGQERPPGATKAPTLLGGLVSRHLVTLELHVCGAGFSHLGNERVDAVVIAAARHCPGLKRFGFDGVSKWESADGSSAGLGDAGLAALAAGVPGLESLRLGSCDDATDAGLEKIATSCRRLKALEISLCAGLSRRGVETVADSCPLLTECSLNGLFEPLVTDAVLERLAANRRLTRLSVTTVSVHGPELTDRGLSACCENLVDLVRLDLEGDLETEELGRAGVLAVAHHATRLRHLRLGAHPGADRTLADAAPLLRDLRVVRASAAAWTDASLEALATHCPRLQDLLVAPIPGRVSDVALHALARCSVLRSLVVDPVRCPSPAARLAALVALISRATCLIDLHVGTDIADDDAERQVFALPADPAHRATLRAGLRAGVVDDRPSDHSPSDDSS